MTTSWTATTKNSTGWTEVNKTNPTVTFDAGSSIGLLLCITRGVAQSTTGITWTPITKS